MTRPLNDPPRMGEGRINAKDAAKRTSMLAEIMDGIAGPNGWYWRDEAETRLRCLQEDAAVFGLVPHERDEMRALLRLLRQHPTPDPLHPPV